MSKVGKLFYLVGPSGVGKDTLLNHLKRHQTTVQQPLVAHRYITRAVRENDENHVELANSDFLRRKESGLFLFDWESHGCSYGMGKEILFWLKSREHVIVNGSRQYLSDAQKIYPALIPIWLTVSEEILRKRLIQRGRENELQIQQRISRNVEMESLKPIDCAIIKNDLHLEDTVKQFLAVIELETTNGISSNE